MGHAPKLVMQGLKQESGIVLLRVRIGAWNQMESPEARRNLTQEFLATLDLVKVRQSYES